MRMLIATGFLVLSLGSTGGTGGIVGGADEVRAFEHEDWGAIREFVGRSFNVDMRGDIAFVGKIVSAFDVCVKDGMVETISKHPVYERKYVGRHRDTDTERDGYMNVIAGHKKLRFPLSYERETKRCYGSRDNRCRVEKEIVHFDESKEIEIVYEKLRGGKRDRRDYETVFTKTYDIPYCN